MGRTRFGNRIDLTLGPRTSRAGRITGKPAVDLDKVVVELRSRRIDDRDGRQSGPPRQQA